MENQSFIHPNELLREIGLRSDQIFVHLGSGPGFYLIPAARIVGKNGKAIGIDVRSDMLAETESTANCEGIMNIQTMRANLENEPGSTLENNSADWVLVANILHQSDPAKILHEAHRIVAVSGQVFIIEWDTAASPLGPPADERISREEVEQVAKSAGLTVTKVLKPSPYHYGLIASKKKQ